MVAAIVEIVQFPKENIGFQWSWWVLERPESGARGHWNTPRAASGDQMDSGEVPGERPEGVWRRFGSSRGAFEAFSKGRFRSKINYLEFPIEEGRRSVFNSSKRMKLFASDQI